MSLKVGVVGATGMVGEVFLDILAESNFPVAELRLFASEKSAGLSKQWKLREHLVRTLENGCFEGLDLVFFSSGDPISAEWAPRAVKDGAYAIDNSAAFRMDPQTALVVPEVNGHLLKELQGPCIIANPNCSTIQLVVALKPLADTFGLADVRVATYQSVSGAGRPGADELGEQVQRYFESESPEPKAFPHPIAFNCIPQIGSFSADGFCSEEIKIMNETRKILSLPNLRISAFTVRVPTFNSHAEAVWVTLEKSAEERDVVQALEKGQGLVVVNDSANAKYPMMATTSGHDPVFVGRVHRDLYNPDTYMLWVVADNLRKGAALNGLQIAQRIFDIH
jgi:aspartate-semialdehyde dehydrogenase